jgi:hypothetical protein
VEERLGSSKGTARASKGSRPPAPGLAVLMMRFVPSVSDDMPLLAQYDGRLARRVLVCAPHAPVRSGQAEPTTLGDERWEPTSASSPNAVKGEILSRENLSGRVLQIRATI